MTARFIRILLLLGVVVAVTWVAARHARPPSLTGVWRDQSPAALLYEFRDDGSVWLVREDGNRPIFNYQLKGGDQLVLYDGMGRRRELLIDLTADRLVLREQRDPPAIFGEFRRER